MDARVGSKDSNASKKPGEMDAYIGSRLRQWRRTMDVDANTLAARVGITYQQLQKYEKGMNRISATRLFAIAREMNVPVSYFFQDLGGAMPGEAPASETLSPDHRAVLANGSGTEALKHYVAIKDPDVRKAVLNLLRTLASDSIVPPIEG